MPLARITTPLPEYFERLAQDLRARGFDVETASPGQFFPIAADLEISVKQCSPEDAAKLAASSGKDMCVLVAPGARDTGIRSIEMIVLQPKAETAGYARHFVTPAQVIEISSALAGPDVPRLQTAHPQVEERLKSWPKVEASVQSTWGEITKTTAQWMEGAITACHAGWEKVRQSDVPLKAFLIEIGEETRKLGRSVSLGLGSLMRRTTRNAADENEPLVPRMFDFSEEWSSDKEQPVIEMPKRKPAPVDRRFWKAAGAAAVAAATVVLAVSVMHRPGRIPAVATAAPVESKAALPASASLKPSAMVEGGNSKSAASSVRMVAAKQIIHSNAADTVVRYGNHPTKAKPAATHPGIKRYSDLD